MAEKIAPKNVAPKNSAKPGTQDATGAKPEKVKRIEYPGLLDAEKKPVKLDAVPADFDPKKHKPLSRKNFAKESTWLLIKAGHAEELAKKYRAMAVTADQVGGGANAGKAKKLVAMQKRMAELEAQLRAELGDDAVNTLKGSLAPAAPAADEKAPA